MKVLTINWVELKEIKNFDSKKSLGQPAHHPWCVWRESRKLLSGSTQRLTAPFLLWSSDSQRKLTRGSRQFMKNVNEVDS